MDRRVYLTEEEARTDRLRRNEQIKAFATITAQFGAALLGAAAVRIYGKMTVEIAVCFWILVGSVLIWFTMWSLGKLEAD
jgi:hypothetical protein